MNKHLTKYHIFSYLFILLMVTFMVITLTYARYTSKVSGDVDASVALWNSNLSSNSSFDLSGLVPGENKQYTFKIKNVKDNKVSEVSQNYTIELKTTNNLPLEFSLTGSSDLSNDDGIISNDNKINFDNGSAVLSGGSLPAASSVTHTYTLTVSWPGASRDVKYVDEIDSLTLVVKANQTK